MKKAEILILEGEWWNKNEAPKILPYFNALAASHQDIKLQHRTIRSAEDIEFYVSRIRKNAGAMLYFACHGQDQSLCPTDDGKAISQEDLLDALDSAKDGAVSFVHFGCCEMVASGARRSSHENVMKRSRARWASGYTKSVDWLPSTFLDLALVTEVFVPITQAADGRTAPLKRKADDFLKYYEQLARGLGFSALSSVSAGELLFPERLSK